MNDDHHSALLQHLIIESSLFAEKLARVRQLSTLPARAGPTDHAMKSLLQIWAGLLTLDNKSGAQIPKSTGTAPNTTELLPKHILNTHRIIWTSCGQCGVRRVPRMVSPDRFWDFPLIFLQNTPWSAWERNMRIFIIFEKFSRLRSFRGRADQMFSCDSTL